MSRFKLKISIANTLGFLISVGAPLYVGSRIPNSIYGVRENPWCWLILLSSLIIFYFSLLAIDEKALKKVHLNFELKFILNFIILVGGTWFWLPSFKPFPDPWMLSVPLMFAFITSIAVYLHEYKIDFDFINQRSIEGKLKLERIKMEHETWFRLFITVLSGYAVTALSVASIFPEIAKSMTSDIGEHKLILDVFIFSLIINALIFILVLCPEFLIKIQNIKLQITRIPRDKS
jgi:hypothetical protein